MLTYLRYCRSAFFVFSIAAALATPLSADVLFVGTQGDCDFVDLQDAIDAAWDGAFIRVQAGWHGRHLGFHVVQKNLTITGGYEKCWGEKTGETTLYATGESQVLNLRSIDLRTRVRLVDLQISGASPDEPAKALRPGVSIAGDIDVEMERVEVHHTEDYVGAGIGLQGISVGISLRRPTLTLVDSRLHNNHALNHGGGLYCYRGDLLVANSAFDGNQAQGGAGASLQDCKIFVDGEAGPLRLRNNTSSSGAGGLGLTRSELIATAGKDGRPSIEAVGNFAGRTGGAIQVAADSVMRADGVIFKDNIAGWAGAAISVRGDSELDLGLGLEGCWTGAGCQIFENNFAAWHGGAIYLLDGRARLEQIMARNNSTGQDGGAFIAAFADSRFELTNGVLSENEGKTLIRVGGSEWVRIVSSTIHTNDLDDAVLAISDVRGVEVSQSIFAFNGAPYLAADVPALFECSFFDGLFPLPPGAVDPGVGDPLFRAPGSFHLAFESPAAEMCDDSTLHAEVDFDFEARPSRGRYEPGADELD